MQVKSDGIEIFLDDLKPEVRKEVEKILGEQNYDVVPVAVIPIPDGEWYGVRNRRVFGEIV